MADFNERFGPWFGVRERQDIADRRAEPWPWHSLSTNEQMFKSTPTMNELSAGILPQLKGQDIPPVTGLSRDAGARDIGPIATEELIKFLIDVDSHNPEPDRVKQMNDPIRRR